MAVRVYDSSWKDDLHLMQQLKEQHNSKGMHLGSENIELHETWFNHYYSRNLITLYWGLRFFNICRHDKNVTVFEVTEAIKKEWERPGQLGYSYSFAHDQNDNKKWNAGGDDYLII